MNIYLIRAGALGDAVLTLPLLTVLRERFPGAKISVIGSGCLLELIGGGPLADELYRLEDPRMGWLFSQGEPPEEWAERFKRASLVFLLMNAPGVLRKIKPLCPGGVFMSAGTGKNGHAADKILGVLTHAGMAPGAAVAPRVCPSKKDRAFAEAFMDENNLYGRRTVVIHPGSGSPGKNWPAERFAAAGRRLVSDFGFEIVVSQGEADENSARDFFRFFGGGAVPARGLSLMELAAVLERCRLYIGNDSGVSHLAAAAGVPCVCVFGPTSPDAWAPRGREVRIVFKNARCSPCPPEARGSCAGRECLDSIGVDEVLCASGGLLKDVQGGSRFLDGGPFPRGLPSPAEV